MKFLRSTSVAASLLLAAVFSVAAVAQPGAKTEPKPAPVEARVVKVDDAGLKDVLKAKGKPRVVNFWATWCAPCIEEFPDLVKLDTEYRGKVDVVTISLDSVDDINTLVPDFLKRMKAEMPAFLLVSADETELISSVQKDWSGGLPFTVVYTANGEQAYFREGKFKPEVLKTEIEKLLKPDVK